jgi:hypothetical protein
VPTKTLRNRVVRFEHRVWEQVQWNIIPKKDISILFRSRIEQRFLVGNSDVALRLRERVTVYFEPLFHFVPKGMTPVIYDEIFFNLNHASWVSRKVVDQNRFFLGYAIKFQKYFVLQVGYMNQFQIVRGGNCDNNILYASFIFSPSSH